MNFNYANMDFSELLDKLTLKEAREWDMSLDKLKWVTINIFDKSGFVLDLYSLQRVESKLSTIIVESLNNAS